MRELDQVARNIRARILSISSTSGEGHVPSSLSVVEALLGSLVFLEDRSLSPVNLVLSKGHAALGLFATLSELRFDLGEDLNDYSSKGSGLGGHPDSLKSRHVSLSSGSLGHGLPFACGLAHSTKINGSGTSPVLVIVGDGELNEGSNWEALMLGVGLELSNLIVVVDDNNSSIRGSSVGNLIEKFQSFELDVMSIDGHDSEEIVRALNTLSARVSSAPAALVLKTIKGKGVAEMELDPEAWHHRSPTIIELEKFLEGVAN
jgi:transketolase